ncbi:amino acid-binding protein [Desulfuromonas carbonis]
MDQRFIMTAFGQDRPGIVADVTRLLFENGCNLEETTMTLLADEFTLILLFTSRDPQVEELLARECRRLERDGGISAFVRPLQARRTAPGAPPSGWVLHVEGEDQAGIVYQVSRYLAEQGVNIIDLKSVVRPAPGSGSPFYVMDIHIQVPATVTGAVLESGLAEVADALNVDVSIRR